MKTRRRGRWVRVSFEDWQAHGGVKRETQSQIVGGRHDGEISCWYEVWRPAKRTKGRKP